MYKLTFKAIKNKFKRHYLELTGKPLTIGPFEQRMKHRHITFWSDPNAEAVRNIPMVASDPLTKWQDVAHWQRKLSNKHNAREYAKMHGCKVPQLYWRGRHPETLDPSTLPDNYVIRPTIGHSSGLVFLMKNGVNLMDKKPYTAAGIQRIMAQALKRNPYLEFLVEEFLRDEKGEYRIPDDYKFYMLNGEVACIQVINRLSPCSGFDSCYDENWSQIPNISTYYPPAACQPAPKCLHEMMEQARQLSKSYQIFVRVDFYATDQGPVFGEFTPTPGLGKTFTPAAEKLFISYWDEVCQDMI